jgi:hypothetical protein
LANVKENEDFFKQTVSSIRKEVKLAKTAAEGIRKMEEAKLEAEK